MTAALEKSPLPLERSFLGLLLILLGILFFFTAQEIGLAGLTGWKYC
jgi:hypothetical protein